MKRYSDLDFVRLIDEVEHQGGRYLPETHYADEYDYEAPDGTPLTLLGNDCEEEALFIVAYDPNATVLVQEVVLEPDTSSGAHKGRKRAALDENDMARWVVVEREQEGIPDNGPLKVCANDDLMRLWPRFRHVIHDPDPGA